MERIHVSGLVHRDIKPENVMLTSSSLGSHIKVLDFGLAERVDVPLQLKDRLSASLRGGKSAKSSPVGTTSSSLEVGDS